MQACGLHIEIRNDVNNAKKDPMQIRTFILSFSLMLQSLICLAESESMVVVKSGVFIRDSTTINSNAIGSVKFGEMVQVLNEPSAKDVVSCFNSPVFKMNQFA